METGKRSQVGPQRIFRSRKPQQANGNHNPDASLATTDHEMADLLKQTFHVSYRMGKRSTPTFHPRTDICMASPGITESETKRALEALNPNKGAYREKLFPKALRILNPYIGPTLSRIFKSLHAAVLQVNMPAHLSQFSL